MNLIAGSRAKMLKASCLAAILLGIGVPASAAGPNATYLLGPMDVLRLRVSEWRTADESFRDWSSVSGTYTVGPTGSIAVPFVGEVPAEGRTTDELAILVSNTLQQRFGLPDRPDSVFEVSRFRPVYVTGDVQTPGALPFAPDLSVVKAVAMAGGQKRNVSPELRIERDVITAQGDLSVSTLEQHRLVMRRARLQAELDGADTLQMPDSLAKAPESAALLEDERVIMVADRERVALQVRSLNELKTLLEGEVQSLISRRQGLQRQIDLSRKEQADVGSLANRGLTVNTRVSELERRIADYEERVLEIDATTLRARQDISKADQDVIKLENDRRSDLAMQRQQADAQIEALSAKRKAQGGLLQEAEQFAPNLSGAFGKGTYSYSLVRDVSGKTVEFAAAEGTEVLPGDVVKVEYHPPSTAY